MFSDQLSDISRRVNELLSAPFDKEEAQTVLDRISSNDRLELRDAAILLSINPLIDEELYQQIIGVARDAKLGQSKGRVIAISPLYVTSICQENCLYCNYRSGNKDRDITRLRLASDELLAEAQYLIENQKLRVIELVYATDTRVRVPEITEHIASVKALLDAAGGGTVGINAEPFEVEDYKALVNAGLDFAVLWQETYDVETYRNVHPGNTKKSNMAYRVDAYERMIAGGLDSLGFGILLGLSDWRKDWLHLLAHELYIRETYGVQPAVLGVPRLKDAPGAAPNLAKHNMTDAEFLLGVSVHNLLFPCSMPFVNTRESWDMCIELAKGGGTLFTFDCTTIPGGYTLATSGYQFPTSRYDINSYSKRLSSHGLYVDVNWSH